MSKVRLAEYHYRKAVEIHPNNAVLLGCVGMVSLYHEFVVRYLIIHYHRLLRGVEIGMQHLPFSIRLRSCLLTMHSFVIVGPRSLSL